MRSSVRGKPGWAITRPGDAEHVGRARLLGGDRTTLQAVKGDGSSQARVREQALLVERRDSALEMQAAGHGHAGTTR